MPLTPQQRNALPRSAFGYAPKGAPRSAWKYPMPTKTQAARAGIPEVQRQRTLHSAVAYSARRDTTSSRRAIQPIADRRGRGKGLGTTRTARTTTARTSATPRRRGK